MSYKLLIYFVPFVFFVDEKRFLGSTNIVCYHATVTFDSSKPDGTMRKVMDVSRINALGWRRTMPLKEGIALSYQDMLSKI